MHLPSPPSASVVPFPQGREPAGSFGARREGAALAGGGRDLERVLLDAWRDAHWTLRLALQDAARRVDDPALESLYDEARRCDNLLSELYRQRADVLARQVRDLVASQGHQPAAASSVPLTPPAGPSSRDLETALLASFRALSAEDQHLLAGIARRLAQSASAGRADR